MSYPLRPGRAILVLLALLLFSRETAAQGPVTGAPPFATLSGTPDLINLGNLNAHLSIPVLHKDGRGTNFTYDLSYDNSVWYPGTTGSTTTWQPILNLGWHAQTEAATGYLTFTSVSTPWCLVGGTYHGTEVTRSNWTYHDALGSTHSFSGSDSTRTGTPGLCTDSNTPLTTTASDGSGIKLAAGGSIGVMTYPNGTTVNAPINGTSGAGSMTDRNGNKLTVNSSGQFFDTLSSTVPVLTVTGAGTSGSPVFLSFTSPSGTSSTYTLHYTNFTLATNFGVVGVGEYRSAAAVPLVTRIDLPDGTQYNFSYEPTGGTCTPYAGTSCVNGRVTTTTLPTGGSINYSYTSTGCGTGIFNDGSNSCLQRILSDGASWSATWNYVRSLGTLPASTTTMTDPERDTLAPNGNQTVLQFQGIYETQRQVYQGLQTGGTLLETINTCYNSTATSCTGTAISLPITTRNVVTQLGASGLLSQHRDTFSATGLPLVTSDYDFIAALPFTTPLRSTVRTYASLGNISAFVQQVNVEDGTGSTIAQTTYTYDGAAVTSTSGTPQHVAVTTARGNLTSVAYPVTGLTSSATYYDTGNIKTSKNVNGGVSTFTYAAGVSSCSNSFPTMITEAITTLKQSVTWNCTGGVMTGLTDENLRPETTSYALDTHFWRPDSKTDRTSATTTFTYTGQNSIESTLTFNSGSSTADTLLTLDGLGRIRIQQTKQSPGASNYDSVETDYNVSGLPSRTTLPYSQTAGQLTTSTAAGVKTTYDALGRVLSTIDAAGGQMTYTYNQNDVLVQVGPAVAGELVKARQLQYDALGRLTSVCELTSGTATWPATANGCAQTTPRTGYWTKYAYNVLDDLLSVQQNAQAATANQQTRTYTYDAMGRLTSEKNPETSQSQINYTYDSDSICTPGSPGDLVKRTDPVGNQTCYAYDAMHRVTSVSYSNGNSANTPNKYFIYDTASVNGSAMDNSKARLAEAYTATTPTGTKITDLGFGYTNRGELSKVYQASLHSGGYYFVQQTYWPNGSAYQLGLLPGLPTFTYNPDGEGRTQTVSASTGVNPVTATTYNTASLPTAVTLGSLDSDQFQYDPSSLRPTQYKFNIGSQSITGNLTWNPNGSLAALSITDPLDSSDTQNCSYSADDLGRVSVANCGPIWGQSFDYDPFGNAKKSILPSSGGTSFLPTYQLTPSITNQISTLPGGFHPSYDPNGNSTNDSFHQYTWDSENRPVSVVGSAGTVNLTYDALGRMVEQGRGANYTQLVYGPSGAKFATMNGSTFQKGFVPLTHGGMVVYNSAGIAYYRHPDWLGSSRFASTPARTMYSDTAYSAFGEPYAQLGTADPLFTGEEQDTATGIYDFLYRKYDPGQSRWVSPDPGGMSSVDIAKPQSWNRYAYVLNNPLGLTDPSGLCPGDDSSSGECGSDSGDEGSSPPVDNGGSSGSPTQYTGWVYFPGSGTFYYCDHGVCESGDTGTGMDPGLGIPNEMANMPNLAAATGVGHDSANNTLGALSCASELQMSGNDPATMAACFGYSVNLVNGVFQGGWTFDKWASSIAGQGVRDFLNGYGSHLLPGNGLVSQAKSLTPNNPATPSPVAKNYTCSALSSELNLLLAMPASTPGIAAQIAALQKQYLKSCGA